MDTCNASSHSNLSLILLVVTSIESHTIKHDRIPIPNRDIGVNDDLKETIKSLNCLEE